MQRKIVKEITITAPLPEVWAAWTTTEGVTSFFAPQAEIELKPGGRYELFFDTEAPEGSRGAEGCTVLSYRPMEMLSFTWNAPPTIPNLRKLGPCAWVVVQFDELKDSQVRIRITHLGIGEGTDWDAYLDYFENAWPKVLDWCKERFEE